MIIGLHGPAKSGKDTIARLLRPSFVRIAFADPLKALCRQLFDWTVEHTDGDLKEVVDPRWGFSPRHALQQIGTEVVRALGEDIWIKRARLTLAEHRAQGQTQFVFTDVRFFNEARFVQEEVNGQLWKVNRDTAGAAGAPNAQGHASENDLANHARWDAIIDNNGTRDELFQKIWSAVDQAQKDQP